MKLRKIKNYWYGIFNFALKKKQDSSTLTFEIGK